MALIKHSHLLKTPFSSPFVPSVAWNWLRSISVVWLWHLQYSVGPHPMSILHVTRTFIANGAIQTGVADWSPGSTTFHSGTLLLVSCTVMLHKLFWSCVYDLCFCGSTSRSSMLQYDSKYKKCIVERRPKNSKLIIFLFGFNKINTSSTWKPLGNG